KSLVDEWGNKIKSVVLSDYAKEKIENILNELETKIAGSLKIQNYDVSVYIKTSYIDYFNLVLGIVVPELNNFPEQKERLWDSVCNYFNLSLANEVSNKMGLFFAGYGKDDAYPKFVYIELYNVIGGKVKYKLIERFEESNNNAKIIPLAQGDVILTFCKGISNSFINYIPQKVDSLISTKIDNLPDIF